MEKKATIQDGAYGNLVTGLGQHNTDKSESTFAKAYTGSNILELARMKANDGLAARIVECVPEDAFKNDITIIGDDDGSIAKEVYGIGLVETLQKAGEYQRFTGGALIVTEYEGESNVQELKNPPSSHARVKGYRVYSAGKVELDAGDFDGDEPRVFRVVLLDNTHVEVNPMRCTVIKGKEVPDMLSGISVKERYFGMPALASCEKSLKNLANIIGAVVNMATETGTMLMSIENFDEMLSKPDSGINDAQNLMSLVKLSMNSMKAIFAGKNDAFQILSHNFGGLPEIMQKAMNFVCADCRIPASVLFGQTATGLSQTNEGDLKDYAQTVSSWRTRFMYRPACRLIEELTERNCTKTLNEFEWGAVNEMSVKEELEAKKLQAETLNIYYQMGAIDAESIRNSVFVNGHSWNVSVEE